MLVGWGVGEYWDSEKDGFSKPRLFFLGKEESAFRQCSGMLAGSQLDLYLSKLPRARV